MSVPFRIRWAEWIAGALLVLIGTVAIAAMLFVSRGQGAFDTPAHFVLRLADGHGVAEGSRVQMLGVDVGRVSSVQITEANEVEVKLEVRAAYVDKVRADTRATLEASLGLQGVLSGIGVALTPGSAQAPALENGAEIEAIEPEHIADMLPGVGADPLVEDIEVLIRNLRVLSDEAADPEGSLRQALASLAVVSKRIEAGEGTAGKMLSDDAALYGELTQALEDVGGTLVRVDRLIKKTSGAVQKSSNTMDAAAELVEGADALIASADTMVDSADTVLKKTGPVIDSTDVAMGELSGAIETFGETTKELQAVTKRLDELIAEMLVVTKAAGKVYPIRRHIKKARRQRDD